MEMLMSVADSLREVGAEEYHPDGSTADISQAGVQKYIEKVGVFWMPGPTWRWLYVGWSQKFIKMDESSLCLGVSNCHLFYGGDHKHTHK